ncbi:hypothetical protein [Mesoterricola sediminis]|uniref:Uncharacterized protein n=1 Tax=Mesoterricola sediminis TaxID=2927980 RepID=A0AA48GX43_9BACT|nr:hypothetical protein [Mesoterricola sediminis]BDU77879.1 hypothetical protein METESE_28370 [Mesoterricola sediminis]
MKNPLHLPLCLLLLAGASSLTPLAADVPSIDDQMGQLHAVISKAVLNGMTGNNFLFEFALPGLPVGGDGWDPTSDDSQRAAFDLADAIYKAKPVMVKNGNFTFSSIYDAIVNNAQSVTPNQLSPKDQKRLSDLQAEWGDGSEKYAIYHKYRDAYYEAEDTHSRERIQGALQDWIGSGNKFAYEGAVHQIQQLQTKTGDAWWSSLSGKFNTAVAMNPNGYPKVTFFPGIGSWTADDGWMTVTYNKSKTVKNSKLADQAIAAGLKGRVGWFKINAEVAKHDMSLSKHLMDSNSSITFKLKRVDIERDWANDLLFLNPNWKLPSNVFNGMLAVGSLNDPRIDQMPLQTYAVSLILAKDIHIGAQVTDEDIKNVEHSLKASVSVGIGPFRIHGSYSKDNKTMDLSKIFNKSGIDLDGVQVIGAICVVPPKDLPAALDPAKPNVTRKLAGRTR